MVFLRRLCWCLYLAGVCLPLCLRAAVPPEKKLAIERRIESELEQALTELVDGKRIAARLGFDYPVKDPEISQREAKKLAEKQVHKAAETQYPDSWVDDQMAKVAGEYAQWQPGQRVTIKTKDGKTMTQNLREITARKIQVGPNWILKEDLVPDVRLHVDRVRANQMKRQDRKKFYRKMLALREAYAREHRVETVYNFYTEHGYLMKEGHWIAKSAYFEDALKAERKRCAEVLRDPLAYKHYYNAGYRLFKGEWFTPEEAARLRELDRIQRELQPAEFMAEMDQLNHEFKAKSISAVTGPKDDDSDLFKEDTGDRGENPFE